MGGVFLSLCAIFHVLCLFCHVFLHILFAQEYRVCFFFVEDVDVVVVVVG